MAANKPLTALFHPYQNYHNPDDYNNEIVQLNLEALNNGNPFVLRRFVSLFEWDQKNVFREINQIYEGKDAQGNQDNDIQSLHRRFNRLSRKYNNNAVNPAGFKYFNVDELLINRNYKGNRGLDVFYVPPANNAPQNDFIVFYNKFHKYRDIEIHIHIFHCLIMLQAELQLTLYHKPYNTIRLFLYRAILDIYLKALFLTYLCSRSDHRFRYMRQLFDLSKQLVTVCRNILDQLRLDQTAANQNNPNNPINPNNRDKVTQPQLLALFGLIVLNLTPNTFREPSATAQQQADDIEPYILQLEPPQIDNNANVNIAINSVSNGNHHYDYLILPRVTEYYAPAPAALQGVINQGVAIINQQNQQANIQPPNQLQQAVVVQAVAQVVQNPLPLPANLPQQANNAQVQQIVANNLAMAVEIDLVDDATDYYVSLVQLIKRDDINCENLREYVKGCSLTRKENKNLKHLIKCLIEIKEDVSQRIVKKITDKTNILADTQSTSAEKTDAKNVIDRLKNEDNEQETFGLKSSMLRDLFI